MNEPVPGGNGLWLWAIPAVAYHILKEKRPYQELGGDYFDRIRAEGLKRYYVRRLQGLGLEVTVTPTPIGSWRGRIFEEASSVRSGLGHPPADQATNASPVIWRATGQYLARPLRGCWATVPYLHNGSVPTLWHLLHPSDRPAKFIVGNREYDAVKLGYSTTGSGWTFDTAQPGNGNAGHVGAQYGTNLNEDQKDALLEYLKTI